MRVGLNLYNTYNVSMYGKQNRGSSQKSKSDGYSKTEKDIKLLLEPFAYTKKATIPPLNLMKGVNPNNKNVFDCFTKIDDVSRSINFVRTQDDWNNCLLEEIEEFNVARREYQKDKTRQNYDHMEEEMGDILYTAASIAKDSGINPEEAFKATNRKFYNRINIMERVCASSETDFPEQLKDCKDYQRRALWNAAKRKLYDAQIKQYTDSALSENTNA